MLERPNYRVNKLCPLFQGIQYNTRLSCPYCEVRYDNFDSQKSQHNDNEQRDEQRDLDPRTLQESVPDMPRERSSQPSDFNPHSSNSQGNRNRSYETGLESCDAKSHSLSSRASHQKPSLVTSNHHKESTRFGPRKRRSPSPLNRREPGRFKLEQARTNLPSHNRCPIRKQIKGRRSPSPAYRGQPGRPAFRGRGLATPSSSHGFHDSSRHATSPALSRYEHAENSTRVGGSTMEPKVSMTAPSTAPDTTNMAITMPITRGNYESLQDRNHVHEWVGSQSYARSTHSPKHTQPVLMEKFPRKRQRSVDSREEVQSTRSYSHRNKQVKIAPSHNLTSLDSSNADPLKRYCYRCHDTRHPYNACGKMKEVKTGNFGKDIDAQVASTKVPTPLHEFIGQLIILSNMMLRIDEYIKVRDNAQLMALDSIENQASNNASSTLHEQAQSLHELFAESNNHLDFLRVNFEIVARRAWAKVMDVYLKDGITQYGSQIQIPSNLRNSPREIQLGIYNQIHAARLKTEASDMSINPDDVTRFRKELLTIAESYRERMVEFSGRYESHYRPAYGPLVEVFLSHTILQFHVSHEPDYIPTFRFPTDKTCP